MMKKVLLLTLILVSSISIFVSVQAAEEKTVIKVAVGGNAIGLTKEIAEIYNERHPNIDVQILETTASTDDRLNLT